VGGDLLEKHAIQLIAKSERPDATISLLKEEMRELPRRLDKEGES